MTPDSELTIERKRMVTTQLHARGIKDERLLRAFERVPRHEFVAPEYRPEAYSDRPLPIGSAQTISQPYIVAAMLELLQLEPQHVVLEIGTGSGYQTAILCELADRVYSIERHEALARRAAETLRILHYTNFFITVGDGTEGYAPAAPFDAIIVAAAAPRIPQPLLEQLRQGGRMVIPVGTEQSQDLALVRIANGRPVVHYLEGCRFVPLIGREGFPG